MKILSELIIAQYKLINIIIIFSNIIIITIIIIL